MYEFTPEEQKALANLVESVDWKDPYDRNGARKALATTITETIQKDLYDQDIVRFLAESRSFNPGEELQFSITKGLRAYVIEPGGFAPRSFVTNTVVTLPKRQVTIAYEINISQLRSGRYGTIADFRRLAMEQLLGTRNALLWSTLYGAVTSETTYSNYATIASGDSVATKIAALDAALSYVDDYNQTGPKAIVGRYAALTFLENLVNSGSSTILRSDSGIDNIMNNGYLGNYKGVPVFRLKSFKDSDGTEQISANNIMIVGDSVKFGIENPGLETYEFFNGTKTRSWEVAHWESYGCLVTQPEKHYRILISG